jgi:RHS repeat-associated protein
MAVGQANSKGVPPTGSLTLSPINPPTRAAGQTQTFTVQASDAAGAAVPNAGVALIINGANMQQLSSTTDATGRTTFSYSAVNAGTDSLQAVANISGLGAFSNMVNVNWTVPAGGGEGTTTFAQQGWIGQPLIGTIVQGQLPITVASGITLTSGTLEFWPTSNPSDVHVINSHTTGSGAIGTFDGTTLANGGYTVQLQATASNGSQLTSVIVVSVIGDSKPGRVTFSTTDLKLPLAGMPITISRTYDSLNRNTSGDFGFGWTLATGVDLQVDAANNVSFTINGQRRTFFFQAQPSSFLFPWLLLPRYFPQTGLHGSLTSDGCGALLQLQGQTVCFPSGPYQPTMYTYTDPIGRVFVIAANGQIQSIKDINGNTLTLGPNGISSSAAGGASVPFVRDTLGRITQITDLNQNSYTYSYDASGNLASVAFPGVALPAAYTYDATHLLKSETDARGNSTSTQYYPDGRVQSVTNGMNNTTSFVYTLNADGTTTTTTTFPDTGVQVTVANNFGKPLSINDPLHRITTFTYDSNQNLKTQTDALGKITNYTYDANGFQTSITDPLHHVKSKVYNQFGGVTSETDPLNNIRTTNYDPNFNPIQWSDSIGQIQAAAYDSAGNLLSLTDGNGKTTNFTYDSRGNLTQVAAPLNQTTNFTYDPMDRIASQTDPRQKTTTFLYDALGHLSDKIDAAHGTTHSVYDGNGNKISETDALQHTTSYEYDTLNRVSKITYPDQTTRQFTYDFRGNKLTETDQLLRVTGYSYDLAGQLKSLIYASGTPDAATVLYTYDADGRKLTQTDGRGNPTTYAYDDAGRMISMTDALNKVTTYSYDAANRRTSVKDPNQHTTSFAYDARNRLKSTTYNDLTTTVYTYDGLGNQRTITDQANQTTTKNYDDLNRVISVQDALQQLTQYTYDLDNNLTSITDANQRATSFQYDDLNRRTRYQLPLLMFETSNYDAVGNLISQTDFNGKTTTFSYDSMNRLLSKTPDPTLNEPAVSYAYNATGKRQTMQDASGVTTYRYDNRDRLITKITPQGTLAYTYDGAGNVLTIVSSNPNGASLSYTYDARDRLATVTDRSLLAHGAASSATTYNYDPAGHLLNYAYPNTVQSSYTYDTLNRLLKMQNTCGSSAGCGSAGTSLATYTYTLGSAGNRLSAAELNGRAVSYGYDGLYRLTSEAISADPASQNGTVSYTYDPVGNRTQLNSGVPAIPSSGVLTYDANDRTATAPYDANGNLLLIGTGNNVYDFENRLVQSGALNIVYDGDGNRVAENAGGITTTYLVDTLNPTGYAQVLDELVNGSVTRTYAFGLQRISQDQLIGGTWTPSFYGYDGHGNVRFLEGATGAVTDTYEYDAFGNLIAGSGATPNRYLFSGEQLDSALHLYYLRARYLNAATGTFLSRDPAEGVIFDPVSLHKYLYASANPVNRIDPLGLSDLFEYTEDVEITFSNHGLAHLIEEGYELTQPEVEAYVEQLVREFLQEAEGTVAMRVPFDIPFAMAQLGNVPWAARIFIVTDALISVSTYFPIIK